MIETSPLFESLLIKEIDSSLRGEVNSSNFLNYIELGKEKNVLNKDILEFYFVKSLSIKQIDNNLIIEKFKIFDLEIQRASMLIERIILNKLPKDKDLDFDTINIINDLIINSLKNKMFFSEDLLGLESLKHIFGIFSYEDCIKNNKENAILFNKVILDTRLKQKPKEKYKNKKI